MFEQRAMFHTSVILLFTSFLLNTTSAMALNTSSAMLNTSFFPNTTSSMTFNTSSTMLNASSLMSKPSSLYIPEPALVVNVNSNMTELLLKGAVSNATGRAVRANTTSGKDPTKIHRDRMLDVYFYVMGCVIPCGLCCNIFCVVIFSLSATLRRTTTGHYLTALACADALFLVGDMVRWSNSEGKDGYYLQFDLMHTSNVLCKGNYWLRYGAKLVSAWVIVAIAVERLITVAAPLKVSRLSTLSRARIAILLLYLVGFGLMAFPLWTVGASPSKKNKDVFKCLVIDVIYYPLNMVLLNFGSLLVPACLILIITILIVTILVRASHRRLEQMEGQNPLARHSAGGSAVRSLRQNTEHQLTAMLIAVCVAFVSFRLPYAISYYMYEVLKVGKEDQWTKLNLFVFMKSADILATFNYVANFFLYCLCGSYFRQQVLATIRCHRKRGGPRFVRPVGNDGSLMAYSSSSRASTSTRTSFISVNFIRMSTIKRNSGLVDAVGNSEEMVKPVDKTRASFLKNVLQGN